jgi:type II secretory pathway component PulM
MTRRTGLRTYLRWMERHPRASYILARMGLGTLMLYPYLWIGRLREKSE